MSKTNPKVLLLALDGWGFKLVKKFLDENKLPTLKKLAAQGAFGSLKSVYPYVTVPAWPAMLTGKNPAKLGVFAFLERNPVNYGLRTVNLKWEKWNPLWNILKNQGKRSIIFNVPTVAAEIDDFPGIIVSGPIMDKKEGVIAYPPELNNELLAQKYKIYASEFEKKSLDGFVKEVTAVTEKQCEYMFQLLEKESWDFFMAGFYYGDVLQHRFWQYMDPDSPMYEENEKYTDVILEYMQMVDKYIGEVLKKIPEDCKVLIASDHGLGPCKAKVDLNALILECGYMALTSEKARSINLPSLRKHSLYFTLQALYKKLSFLPPLRKIRNWLWDRLPKDERSWRDVDWEHTRAYCSWYSVFINLKGREPRGIVEPGKEYETLREEIIGKLMEYKDPETGGNVFKKIWRKEELYNGPYMDRMPDLLVDFTGESLYWSTTGEIAPGMKVIEPSTGYSGAHVRDGIIFGYGPCMKVGVGNSESNLLDIAPTILHLLNIPIPKDIDGKVLKEIFKPESSEYIREESYSEVSDTYEASVESSDEEEDQKVKDRLKSLGYLD